MNPRFTDEAFKRDYGRYLCGVKPGLPPDRERPATCRVCACPVNDGYPECPRCHQVRRASIGASEAFPIDYAALLTYAVEGFGLLGRGAPGRVAETHEAEGRQAYAVLKGYKAEVALPLVLSTAAAWIVWFLEKWGPGAPWPSRRTDGAWFWAVVPAVRSGRRGEHPLHRIVAAVLDSAAEVPLRVAATGGDRGFDRGMFGCDPVPDGAPVVLIDDSWTSGGNVFSAAATLRRAGAAAVNTMVLGRLLNPGAWEPSRRFIDLGGLRAGFDPAQTPWAKVS